MKDMEEATDREDEDLAEERAEQPAVENAVEVLPVPSMVVREIWKHVSPLIECSLSKGLGEMMAEDVMAALLTADMQLWLVTKGSRQIGAVVTEIVIFPRRKMLNIVALGGEEASCWLDAVEEALATWAAEMECSGLLASARYGFAKIGRERGWKRAYTVMHREIG